LTLEAPELVQDLRDSAFGKGGKPTVRPGIQISIDVATATATVSPAISVTGKASYPVTPVGLAAQELVQAGGLEAWITQQVAASQ